MRRARGQISPRVAFEDPTLHRFRGHPGSHESAVGVCHDETEATILLEGVQGRGRRAHPQERQGRRGRAVDPRQLRRPQSPEGHLPAIPQPPAEAQGGRPEGPERSGGGAKRLEAPGAEAIRGSSHPHETRKSHINEEDETIASVLSDPPPTASTIHATLPPDLSPGSHVFRVVNLNDGCETSNDPINVTEEGGGCGLLGIEVVGLIAAVSRRKRRLRCREMRV